MLKRLMSCLCAAAIVLAGAPVLSFADEVDESVYYIGSAVNAGLDTGYSESAEFSRDDWHFGWELGRFSITGYTSMTEDGQGRPVFLKTAGDEIKLSFKLNQDIDALNGSENLSINADADGYNQHFGIDRTDFGRGTLIIRQTNYQNATSEPQVYTDYLEGIEVGRILRSYFSKRETMRCSSIMRCETTRGGSARCLLSPSTQTTRSTSISR